MRDEENNLRLAAGRNSKGEPLLDDTTISHSILDEGVKSNSEFVITDTSQSLDLAGRHSIVAYDLRTVICIPLRKPQVQTTRDTGVVPLESSAEVMGALYVDSRFASRDISSVSNDILRAIATEAASLIENARLVQAEEASRRYQQELSIAASIQQRLMAVTIPEVPFARLKGRNLSCKEIGGDFFDAVNTDEGLAVVLADVSGKGVSAALLASTLQGMQTASARGTWTVAANGDVVFSREFIKPSGQPLTSGETAKAIDPRGSPFLQIEVAADQELTYYKKLLPW